MYWWFGCNGGEVNLRYIKINTEHLHLSASIDAIYLQTFIYWCLQVLRPTHTGRETVTQRDFPVFKSE